MLEAPEPTARAVLGMVEELDARPSYGDTVPSTAVPDGS
jgi:hypothetical protein